MTTPQELRKLAEAATPGPWMRLFGERTVYDRTEDGCRGVPIVSSDYSPPLQEEAKNLDYIAAANPQTIISLLDQIEQLQKQKADWVETARNLRAERDALAANLQATMAYLPNLEALAAENETLRTEKKAREDQKPHLWIDEYAVLYKSHRDANAGRNLHALYLHAGAKNATM
jgi:regulator of replication initiation timing